MNKSVAQREPAHGLELRRQRKLNPRALRLRAILKRYFHDLVSALPFPLSVLDAGGTPAVWERLVFAGRSDSAGNNIFFSSTGGAMNYFAQQC